MFSSILLPPPPTSTLFPYTTLFRSDAILSADSTLEALRREQGDRYRYGIVPLSDGADTPSRTSPAQLEAQSRTSEAAPGGVQIHTIGMRSHADQAVLTRIANSAHVNSWRGNSASAM